jgi:hypothetical protein
MRLSVVDGNYIYNLIAFAAPFCRKKMISQTPKSNDFGVWLSLLIPDEKRPSKAVGP